jgi:hypothetical protein
MDVGRAFWLLARRQDGGRQENSDDRAHTRVIRAQVLPEGVALALLSSPLPARFHLPEATVDPAEAPNDYEINRIDVRQRSYILSAR